MIPVIVKGCIPCDERKELPKSIRVPARPVNPLLILRPVRHPARLLQPAPCIIIPSNQRPGSCDMPLASCRFTPSGSGCEYSQQSHPPHLFHLLHQILLPKFLALPLERAAADEVRDKRQDFERECDPCEVCDISTIVRVACLALLFSVILLAKELLSRDRAANALQRDLGHAVMRTYTMQGPREP